jgi:hypothetical protein
MSLAGDAGEALLRNAAAAAPFRLVAEFRAIATTAVGRPGGGRRVEAPTPREAQASSSRLETASTNVACSACSAHRKA